LGRAKDHIPSWPDKAQSSWKNCRGHFARTDLKQGTNPAENPRRKKKRERSRTTSENQESAERRIGGENNGKGASTAQHKHAPFGGNGNHETGSTRKDYTACPMTNFPAQLGNTAEKTTMGVFAP